MGSNYDGSFLEALQKLGVSSTSEPTIVDETVSKDHETGTTSVPDPGGVTVSNIWRHPDAHPIVLDLLLIKKFGPEWLTLEPETLQMMVPKEFNTQSLSDLNLSKLQACKTLHVVDSFWKRWEVFTWCTMALNGEFPDFEVMQVPTVAQCLVSVDIANRIRADVHWSFEVEGYLETVHRSEGVLVPIPPLDFIHPDYKDLDVDEKSISSRWPDVRSSNKAPGGDTTEDEQLRRMLQVYDYLEESRARLRIQLSMVSHAQV